VLKSVLSTLNSDRFAFFSVKIAYSMKKLLLFLFVICLFAACSSSKKQVFTEQHRPQYHFTPQKGWMNDPNGMVYFKGEYHLFYQYYPDSTVWGPMHWGHAVSKDMLHWQHLPIGLFPDKFGYIFSGSAVVDEQNTSGFGKGNEPPLVAIFTYHDMAGEKAKKNDFQSQGIAYSLDNGHTWTKYADNPVIKNQGSRDFRDPKVMWHKASNQWIMTLAVADHVEFYGSKDLKNWAKAANLVKQKGRTAACGNVPIYFL
jgi:fructan beta-fructosidase